MKDLDAMKDNNITIFHAIGKFLYNKRIDPKTKEARQMTSDELLDRGPRGKKPKFYEKHAEILANTLLEDHVLSLYLHENMLNHYNEIDDVSACLDIYSELDGTFSKIEN